MLRQVTEKARQWEGAGSFTIMSKRRNDSVFVPLLGVRKALSARIVNSFVDAEDTAYTIWVHDLESGREWYAPVRYFRDFQDLRAATLALHPCISQFPFPKANFSIFGSPVRGQSSAEKQEKYIQLESFLRSLNACIYRESLNPCMAEIAIHVQSFLGCDAVLGPSGLLGLSSNQDSLHRGPYSFEDYLRSALKKSLQYYAFRLFLLDPLRRIVDTFISTLRSQGPRLKDIEQLEAEGESALKNRAIQELTRVQAFMDQLQEIVLEGCSDDFRSIAEREDYESLHYKIEYAPAGNEFWDRLVREAVREQIEIEVYVPMRVVLSRWLVNGWKHEDMEIHYKIRELRKRQGDFLSRSIASFEPLKPVAAILKGGVEQSTLPSVKLRSIVEAAMEISRIYSSKFKATPDGEAARQESYMGADVFLPIFIYCVVEAEMERPCALSVLLRTLCDPMNRFGETGYYLASFEAAVTHLEEFDLTQERDDMQSSFVSIPL